MADPKGTQPKKNIEVPTTDASQTEDKSTKRFIFWMIAVTVLVVLVGGGIIYWQIGLYVNQSNKNKAQDMEISDLNTKIKNLELLKPNYEKIIANNGSGSSDADLILRALPVGKGYDELVAMLEKMAQGSGVKVTSVTQTEATEGQGGSGETSTTPIPYTFTVTLEGSNSSILEFLKKTENSARVMNFSAMNITGSPSGGTNQASITMQTFHQPQANINPKTEELK